MAQRKNASKRVQTANIEQKTASVGVRMRPSVKEAMEAAARDERRSLASMVELALEEWLREKGKLN